MSKSNTLYYYILKVFHLKELQTILKLGEQPFLLQLEDIERRISFKCKFQNGILKPLDYPVLLGVVPAIGLNLVCY